MSVTAEHAPLWSHAEDAIRRSAQRKLPISDLVERVSARAGREVDAPTLTGVIAQKARQGRTFKRVAPGIYGLKGRK